MNKQEATKYMEQELIKFLRTEGPIAYNDLGLLKLEIKCDQIMEDIYRINHPETPD